MIAINAMGSASFLSSVSSAQYLGRGTATQGRPPFIVNAVFRSS